MYIQSHSESRGRSGNKTTNLHKCIEDDAQAGGSLLSDVDPQSLQPHRQRLPVRLENKTSNTTLISLICTSTFRLK